MADMVLAGTGAARAVEIVQGTAGTDVVKHVRVENITITHTGTTYLDKYETPSGGDWAIHRGGM